MRLRQMRLPSSATLHPSAPHTPLRDGEDDLPTASPELPRSLDAALDAEATSALDGGRPPSLEVGGGARRRADRPSILIPLSHLIPCRVSHLVSHLIHSTPHSAPPFTPPFTPPSPLHRWRLSFRQSAACDLAARPCDLERRALALLAADGARARTEARVRGAARVVARGADLRARAHDLPGNLTRLDVS
jgi:hypothetical protein